MRKTTKTAKKSAKPKHPFPKTLFVTTDFVGSTEDIGPDEEDGALFATYQLVSVRRVVQQTTTTSVEVK